MGGHIIAYQLVQGFIYDSIVHSVRNYVQAVQSCSCIFIMFLSGEGGGGGGRSYKTRGI